MTQSIETKGAPLVSLPIAASETESILLIPFGKTSLPMTWNRAVKLVKGIASPDMTIDSVTIGQTLCEGAGRTWEGRRVEKGVTLTANVSNNVNASKPCKVTWEIQEVAQFDEVPLPVVRETPTMAQMAQSFQAVWPRAIRLLGYKVNPGFTVTEVTIGAAKFTSKESWEGRRVEKSQIVTTTVNGQGPGESGEWLTEEVPQLVEVQPQPSSRPAGAQVLGSVGVAHVPADQVHQAVPVTATPYVPPATFAPPVAVPVGQVAMPNAAPPPANMAPGSQYVQQVSGPPVVHGRQASETYVGHNVQPAAPAGQIIQHMGGAPAMPGSDQGPPRPDEYIVLLSRERARMMNMAMSGAIIPVSEHPSILSPMENALAGAPGQYLKAGMNELAMYLTRRQIELCISILKGTDYQEREGVRLMFSQACS